MSVFASHPRNQNINTTETPTCFGMRPSRAFALTGVVTSLALMVLGGIASAQGLGLVAIGIGVVLGYASYNTYHVLTNLDRIDRHYQQNLGTIGSLTYDLVFSTNQEADLTYHPLYSAAKTNTIWFDWAVRCIANHIRETSSIGPKLDLLDQMITLQPCLNLCRSNREVGGENF